MEIRLIRRARKPSYTIGSLFINGNYYCDTLEDRDRGLTSSMPLDKIRSIKVQHQTAIPTGRYRISVEKWLTHPQYDVPMLHNVPGFSGILIHNGVNDSHTSGCILVGRNTKVGQLTESKRHMIELTTIIRQALLRGEKVEIEIS